MILLGIDSALWGAEITKGRTGQKECLPPVNNFTHGHTGKSLKILLLCERFVACSSQSFSQVVCPRCSLVFSYEYNMTTLNKSSNFSISICLSPGKVDMLSLWLYYILWFFARVNCLTSCRATKKSLQLFVPRVPVPLSPAAGRPCSSSSSGSASREPRVLCLHAAQHSEGQPGAQQGHLQWWGWSPSTPVTKIRLFVVRVVHKPINCL